MQRLSNPPKRPDFRPVDCPTSWKGRVLSTPKNVTNPFARREKVSAATNTALPGCPSDQCLYHCDNPRVWTVDEVGEYISATDCKNYATYFMDQVRLPITTVIWLFE